jgi:uncharacterized protein
MELKNKLATLDDRLAKYAGLVIGFSGGVDSTFLISEAYKVLQDKVLAVTVDSVFCPQRELKEADKLAAAIGIRHLVLQVNPLSDKTVAANPADRCYYCKKKIFSELLAIARKEGFAYVADGSNVDDDKDYRPGRKALQELKIVSPLYEAGLTKADIRQLSRERQLPTWQKESAACLASRIPYGEELTMEKLHRVEEAEAFLIPLNLKHLRVRSHGQLARIEVAETDLPKFLAEPLRTDLVTYFRKIGFKFVTLDLEGYRTGSLNEVLPK